MISFHDISLGALLLAVNSILAATLVLVAISVSFRIGSTSLRPRFRYIAGLIGFAVAVGFPVIVAFDGAGSRPATVVVIERSSDVISSGVAWSAGSIAETHVIESPLPSTTVSPDLRLNFPRELVSVLFGLWLTVAFVLMFREIVSHVVLRKRRRAWDPADETTRLKLGVPPDVKLYFHNNDGIFAAGLFDPVVVLPRRVLEEFPAETVQRVLRHELDHVAWRDPLIHAILRILRAAFWFNLPLWFIERRIRFEREAAADFSVAESCAFDSAAVTDYARSLVELVRWSAADAGQRRIQRIAPGIGSNGLEKRIQRLFHVRRARPELVGAALLVLSLGVAGLYLLPTAVSATRSKGVEVVLSDGNRTFQSLLPSYQLRVTEFANVTPGSAASRTVQQQSDVSSDASTTPPEVSATPPEDRKPSIEIDASDKFGVTEDYIAELASVGYSNLPIETLADMKRLGVSAAFVSEMASIGYTGLSPELLLDYRRHGVSRSYVEEMRRFGYYDLSPQMLLDFKRLAVSAAYIREIAELGYGGLSAEMILDFRRQAVSASFINDISDVVSRPPTARELVALRQQAVSTQFVAELKRLDYDEVSPSELISLKQNAVTADFVERMNKRDATNHSIAKLVSMRVNGER